MGIVIPDGGTIGSASDTDAISIGSDGNVTLSQTNPTLTLGSNARLPQGSIANVHCSTVTATPTDMNNNDWSHIPAGSSVSYTPPIGTRYVIYQYACTFDNKDSRSIISFRLELDSEAGPHEMGIDTDATNASFSGMLFFSGVITLSSITSDFSGHSGGHNWQTNAGGTSAFSASTLRLACSPYNSDYELTLHRIENAGASRSNVTCNPTTTIYSVM